MKLSKRIIAVGAAASALTLSAAGFVAAAGVQGEGPASVLSNLVDDGTLTQDQADKVGDAFETQREERQGMREERQGMQEESRAQMQALITSTLGISEEDLESAREDGTSLAELAGDQKDALIAAIADHMTSKIDQGVAAGNLTQEQADEMKADATSRATDIVEGNGGRGRGHGGPGKGRGGPGGPGGGPAGSESSDAADSNGTTENSGLAA